MEYATTFGGGKRSAGDTTSASTKQQSGGGKPAKQRKSGKSRKNRSNKQLKAQAASGQDHRAGIENDDDYYKMAQLSPDGNNDHDSEHSSTEARDQVCHDKF